MNSNASTPASGGSQTPACSHPVGRLAVPPDEEDGYNRCLDCGKEWTLDDDE